MQSPCALMQFHRYLCKWLWTLWTHFHTSSSVHQGYKKSTIPISVLMIIESPINKPFFICWRTSVLDKLISSNPFSLFLIKLVDSNKKEEIKDFQAQLKLKNIKQGFFQSWLKLFSKLSKRKTLSDFIFSMLAKFFLKNLRRHYFKVGGIFF